MNMQVPLRLYEDEIYLPRLATKLASTFEEAFTELVEYCLAQPARTEDPRADMNMPPEPYRPEASASNQIHLLRERALSLFGISKYHWEWLYQSLCDEPSRRLLLLILAYRSLGFKFVKLPLDNSRLRKAISDIGTFGASDGLPEVVARKNLQKFYLEPLGRNLTVFSDPFGIFNEFVYPQYTYRGLVETLGPRSGEYVLDCGACYGGTSLNFCDLVGSRGKVYSFEFERKNTDVFRWNVHLNPVIQSRLTLIERPVWNASGVEMQVQSAGPASQVHTGATNGEYSVTSISIDDFVAQSGLPRLDFIKMDIEGAEMEALKGAFRTIEKFKPKLAICLYHRISDFVDVPQLIKGIHPDYRLFIGHSSTHGDETVLFAV